MLDFENLCSLSIYPIDFAMAFWNGSGTVSLIRKAGRFQRSVMCTCYLRGQFRRSELSSSGIFGLDDLVSFFAVCHVELNCSVLTLMNHSLSYISLAGVGVCFPMQLLLGAFAKSHGCRSACTSS